MSRFITKKIITIMIIVLLFTLTAGTLTTILHKPFFIHVRVTDITWPPPLNETRYSEFHTGYTVYVVFEIWNPYKRTFIHSTPNSNLLDPQMIIGLENNYTSLAYYIFWIQLTTHKIRPGTEKRLAILMISIHDYNDSIPPIGNYTIWADFDGNPVYSKPSFNVTSYETIIYHTYNESYIESESIPENWGEIYPYNQHLTTTLLWSLATSELVIIGIIFFTLRKKIKLESIEEPLT